jgi:hypothetical protein
MVEAALEPVDVNFKELIDRWKSLELRQEIMRRWSRPFTAHRVYSDLCPQATHATKDKISS